MRRAVLYLSILSVSPAFSEASTASSDIQNDIILGCEEIRQVDLGDDRYRFFVLFLKELEDFVRIVMGLRTQLVLERNGESMLNALEYHVECGTNALVLLSQNALAIKVTIRHKNRHMDETFAQIRASANVPDARRIVREDALTYLASAHRVGPKFYETFAKDLPPAKELCALIVEKCRAPSDDEVNESKVEALIERCANARLFHGDVTLSNMMISQTVDRGDVLVFIDWERGCVFDDSRQIGDARLLMKAQYRHKRAPSRDEPPPFASKELTKGMVDLIQKIHSKEAKTELFGLFGLSRRQGMSIGSSSTEGER